MLPHENDFANPVDYRGIIYDGDQIIGTAVAGLIAERNRRTIINWCKKGYLPSKRIGGVRGQYSIIIGDLIAILETPGSSKPSPVNADVAA